MKIARIAICLIVLIALGITALVLAHPYLLKMAARTQAENDYRRLVSEAKSEIYVGTPELIERIVLDRRYAKSITKVHLVAPDGKNMDFARLRELPNLASVTVDYCHEIDSILSTLNTLPSLKQVDFYYCGPPDIILQTIGNKNLTRLAIHSYQPWTEADPVVGQAKERMPNCTIQLTSD